MTVVHPWNYLDAVAVAIYQIAEGVPIEDWDEQWDRRW